jgi:hypothetical protein
MQLPLAKVILSSLLATSAALYGDGWPGAIEYVDVPIRQWPAYPATEIHGITTSRANCSQQPYAILQASEQLDDNLSFSLNKSEIGYDGIRKFLDHKGDPFKIPRPVLEIAGHGSGYDIAGIGNAKDVSGHIERMLNKMKGLHGVAEEDVAVFLNTCHGSVFGSEVTRVINEFDPATGLTKGRTGANGQRYSKLLRGAAHRGDTNDKSGYRHLSADKDWAFTLPSKDEWRRHMVSTGRVRDWIDECRCAGAGCSTDVVKAAIADSAEALSKRCAGLALKLAPAALNIAVEIILFALDDMSHKSGAVSEWLSVSATGKTPGFGGHFEQHIYDDIPAHQRKAAEC